MKLIRTLFRLLPVGVGLLLLAFNVTTQAAAQGTGWRAYLLAGEDGRLLVVGPGGQEAAYTLDLPPNSFISAGQMRVTDDGSRAAYCLMTLPAQPDGFSTYTLVVRDIPNEVTLVQRELGPVVGCTVSAFDGATGRVAVGIVPDFPQAGVEAVPGDLWQLLLIDATTGATLHSLTDASPGAPRGADILPDFPDAIPLMNEVKLLAGEVVVFTAIPWVGMGGVFDLPAYAWNLTTGDIGQAAAAWGGFGIDYQPATGELAYIAADPERPAGNPGGPMPQNNVVRVLDANGGITTVFHDPVWLVTDVKFVNGGEQLAVQLIDSFNPAAQSPTQDYRVVLVNRDGSRVDALRYPNFLWLRAVPGGMITLWSEVATAANPAPPTHIDYFDGSGSGVRVWTFAPQEGLPVFWEPVWVTPDTPVGGWAPFAAQ